MVTDRRRAPRRASAWNPSSDAAVSTVVATILLVALALVSSMAVYVFADAFATDGSGVDRAGVSLTAVDTDGDRDADWIRLLLVTAPGGPYTPAMVGIHLTDDEGNGFLEDTGLAEDEHDPLLCLKTEARAGENGLTAMCDDRQGRKTSWFAHGETWSAGQALFVPCQDASGDGSGTHLLTVRIRDVVVVDKTVICEEASGLNGGPGKGNG